MGLVVREVVCAPRAHVLVRRRYGVYTTMSGVFSDHWNFSLCFVHVVSHAVLCACGIPPDGYELNTVRSEHKCCLCERACHCAVVESHGKGFTIFIEKASVVWHQTDW